MLSHRKKLQTSSQPKRKHKFILPLSRPKLILEQTAFNNLTSDIDRTFNTLISKNTCSIKSLNTHRPQPKQSNRLQTEQCKLSGHFRRANQCKGDKSKFDVVLVLPEQQIPITFNANTVEQLNREVRKTLKRNGLHCQYKTVQTEDKHLGRDYLLSIPNIPLKHLLYHNIKLELYQGEKCTEPNLHNFQVIRAIGSGGFSTVFLARFKGDGRFYALKVISKSFILKNKKQRLVINEKNVMTTSQHPFLAKLHWSFQSKNFLIFVMDYYPGGELFGALKKLKRMNESMAKFFVTQILLGLEDLHKAGIAYRDLKPQNILLDKNGHACISDFGLVKPGLKNASSRAYSFCGSPEYMSPEVVAKKGHSLCADFYSLGALLFELLTGLPPFYNRDPEQIYKGTLNGSLIAPSYLSQNAKDLLMKLLCKSQKSRLGAKQGVEEILKHAWFGSVDRQLFLKKELYSPLSFNNPDDLNFNEAQMRDRNEQLTFALLRQQQQSATFAHMFPDFRFSRGDDDIDHKENLSKTVSRANFLSKKQSIQHLSFTSRFKKVDNFL